MNTVVEETEVKDETIKETDVYASIIDLRE
jgi:hypothetical protein